MKLVYWLLYWAACVCIGLSAGYIYKVSDSLLAAVTGTIAWVVMGLSTIAPLLTDTDRHTHR